MKKLFITLVLGALLCAPLSLLAHPMSLGDILPISGAEQYKDTQYEAAGLSHTGHTETDATFFLFMEAAGWADANTFGLYGYTQNDDGSILLGDSLEVFSGADAPGFGFPTSTTLQWDLAAGTVTNQSSGDSAGIGHEFGFYITTPADGDYQARTWYSHSALNVDNADHLMMFDTSDNSLSSLGGSDIVLAWDDQDFGIGSDHDYNDMVIGISDVLPVPEPAPLALLSLLTLLIWRRRSTR